MFDLINYIEENNQKVNTALKRIIHASKSSAPLIEAMKYSLFAGGKRIRPILCLAAAEAVGGIPEDALPAACALEMIHTYSLIHDDLPAMDDDDLRRGKPTCHKAYDEATAILAGDALLTLAFEVVSSVRISNDKQAAKWLRVIRLISGAAGFQGMIQGQMLDIISEGSKLSIAELESMHTLKTGALIEASLQCGALLGGADHRQMKMLRAYGRNIGLAFQVADDILNVEGKPEMMGKAVGTDKLLEKSTYPSLLGLEASKQVAKKLVANALQALENFDKKADALRAIAAFVIARKR